VDVSAAIVGKSCLLGSTRLVVGSSLRVPNRDIGSVEGRERDPATAEAQSVNVPARFIVIAIGVEALGSVLTETGVPP
jgi:hypothetical protein